MVRNVTAYLDALNHAAERTKTDFECIVVDDHSLDSGLDLLSQQLNVMPELRLLQMGQNVGPGLTREAGAAIARGEWVWFLDDDDRLDRESLVSLLSILRDAAADTDIVAHSLKHRYSADSVRTRHDLGLRVMTYKEYQEVFRYVVRRSMLLDHGIRFSSGLHEDIRYITESLIRSRTVLTMEQTVVLKQMSEDAITARMSTQRIDGYIQAYIETKALLMGSDWGNPKQMQQLWVQTLGVLLLQITREPDLEQALALMAHLDKRCQDTETVWSTDFKNAPRFSPLATNYEYAGTVWMSGSSSQYINVLSKLRDVFKTRLSCKDLDSSLFLGPDEIRACCKRFFVNGIRKGDVVLLKADADITLENIHKAKKELIDRLNSGDAHECSGCPYIERREIVNSGIDYLSLENFAHCNMRCTYCSPKYYGGTEARYNAAAIVAQLAEQEDGFSGNCHVVWGGGEPTLSPRFDAINKSLATMPQSGKIRILSNSLKYSKNLEHQLIDSRFHLVTSIDAGTEITFRSLRGKPGLNDVIENLVNYQNVMDDPRRLTIKYIVGRDNHSSQELKAFVDRLQKSTLLNSLFQVSCDFTLDEPDDRMICALYELAVRLLDQGAYCVFFDDLVRDRVRMTSDSAQNVLEHLAVCGFDDRYLITEDAKVPVVLWGSGKQSQWMIQHTTAGQNGRFEAVVSNENDYLAVARNKRSIGDPYPRIYPSGVQSIYEILVNIERAGLSERIKRGVPL